MEVRGEGLVCKRKLRVVALKMISACHMQRVPVRKWKGVKRRVVLVDRSWPIVRWKWLSKRVWWRRHPDRATRLQILWEVAVRIIA